ncbi:MAG: hypothetical protein ABI813_00645 [Bacteroidota bacterium]
MKLELLGLTPLENYPYGSGIEFYDDKIYIIGDDSRDLLIMNKKWSKSTLIDLVDAQDKKTPKTAKSDLEAMTLLNTDKKPQLLIIGSGATEKRNKALLLQLKTNAINWIDLSVFYNKIRTIAAPVLNIEGIAEVYDYLVMVNRGNENNPGNHLVITKADFWKNQDKANMQTVLIDFADFDNKTPAGGMGVTGLRYSDKHEDLFLTVSTADKTDAAGGRVMGKSYLAVIENLYRKIGREKGKIKVNHLIDLTEADKRFEGYKIESVCIQSQKDHSLKLQMIGDNEQGKTFLFKVWLGW